MRIVFNVDIDNNGTGSTWLIADCDYQINPKKNNQNVLTRISTHEKLPIFQFYLLTELIDEINHRPVNILKCLLECL